ncbi:MAG: hypothetical protein ACLTW9_22320 [Enterocloster sp.]
MNPGDNSYLKDDNIAGGGGTGGIGGGTTTEGIEITSGNDYEVVDGIVNYPLNSLVIKKADANTGEMLDGATFEVFRITGETSGQNGKLICTATTDQFWCYRYHWIGSRCLCSQRNKSTKQLHHRRNRYADS